MIENEAGKGHRYDLVKNGQPVKNRMRKFHHLNVISMNAT